MINPKRPITDLFRRIAGNSKRLKPWTGARGRMRITWKKLQEAGERVWAFHKRREAAKEKVNKLLRLANDQAGKPEGQRALERAQVIAVKYSIKIQRSA